MNVLLISTYDLGRQPFGLASPAAWLRLTATEVNCLDLSRERVDEGKVRAADMIAFFLPMHTATRIALHIVGKIRALNPSAHLCAYGLYAPIAREYLHRMGFQTFLGGEFEEGLNNLVLRLRRGANTERTEGQVEPLVSLQKQRFILPDRRGLPMLPDYAHLIAGDGTRRIVGYTEASRGCKHLCRHCPIVPVYGGQFRVVQRDVVLEDIRQQVQMGAAHITFGDPDFFNGVGHSLKIVEELHREFPGLTYDVTIKIEHLLKHAESLAVLRDTGCLFVTSAVESIDDTVLKYLAKDHTRADFIEVVHLFRKVGLVLNPTFVAFTPWITLEGYKELLYLLAENELIENVAPIQLAIRLLIPPGSRLLDLPEIRRILGRYDESSLSYRWEHPDPLVDELQSDLEKVVAEMTDQQRSRQSIFVETWTRLQEKMGSSMEELPLKDRWARASSIPHLSEPWYCCAEPVQNQLAPF